MKHHGTGLESRKEKQLISYQIKIVMKNKRVCDRRLAPAIITTTITVLTPSLRFRAFHLQVFY
jgi:hypothetical protein